MGQQIAHAAQHIHGLCGASTEKGLGSLAVNKRYRFAKYRLFLAFVMLVFYSLVNTCVTEVTLTYRRC